MSFHHAVVWLDHSEAHVLYFNAEASEAETLKAHPRHPRVHANSGDRHALDDPGYFAGVALALAEAQQILIAGPAQEKIALASHLAKHHPNVAANIVGIETVHRSSGAQLLAHARKYFLKADLFR